MKLSEIKKNSRNPRIIKDAKFERLKNSIKEFPAMMELRPIIVDETMTILGGNMRFEAIKASGLKEIPDNWIKRAAELTDDEKARFVITDNSSFGEYDWDLIANEWTDYPLEDWGLDLPDFLETQASEIEEDESVVAQLIDNAAELNKKWNVKMGDLWQVGKHRLLCGDSSKQSDVDWLLGNQKATTIFFDPPFDADASLLKLSWNCSDALVFSDHRHLFDCVEKWGKFRSIFVWDGVTSWYVKGQPLARAKFCLWFGESDYSENGAHYGDAGKPKTVTNSRGTYDYVPDERGKHLSTVFQSPNTQQFEGHKHSKPIEWLRMLVANCTNGIVFDPFAGSGSAMVACESLKRVCLAIELEANNVAVILERMSLLGLTPKLIEG